MNRSPVPVNPRYAARSESRSIEPIVTRYAKLPAAPVNASPVPHLTSLYHADDTGEFGNRRYPGNCGGVLIYDLLTYFRPANVFDPMSGSGTCREVCESLKIPCVSGDIHAGFDACDKTHWPLRQFDFIWAHPPYWRQKLYAADPRDLSRLPTLQRFLERYAAFIRQCADALSPNGHVAILMGDYPDREEGFVSLTYHTKRIAFACGLRQACTDIIRFSHGTGSSRKIYRTSFIPTLHDTCLIFRK